MGAGAYVYLLARRPMKQGMPPNPGAITQMVVGISERAGAGAMEEGEVGAGTREEGEVGGGD